MANKPRIMIVQSRFYEDIADHLLTGATQALEEEEATYEIHTVPGALEIPIAIDFGRRSGKFDGYVALGAVIRGETSHYDIVAGESARGLTDLSLEHGLAIGNGILTCDTREQALVRADPEQKNKGKDAVRAVLALVKIQNDMAA